MDRSNNRSNKAVEQNLIKETHMQQIQKGKQEWKKKMTERRSIGKYSTLDK